MAWLGLYLAVGVGVSALVSYRLDLEEARLGRPIVRSARYTLEAGALLLWPLVAATVVLQWVADTGLRIFTNLHDPDR
jgi:hypothetical protein